MRQGCCAGIEVLLLGVAKIRKSASDRADLEPLKEREIRANSMRKLLEKEISRWEGRRKRVLDSVVMVVDGDRILVRQDVRVGAKGSGCKVKGDGLYIPKQSGSMTHILRSDLVSAKPPFSTRCPMRDATEFQRSTLLTYTPASSRRCCTVGQSFHRRNVIC